jgi:hypothetical protein
MTTCYLATTTTIPLQDPHPERVRVPHPHPGYIILVHGVNDVGEAYSSVPSWTGHARPELLRKNFTTIFDCASPQDFGQRFK